MSPAATQLLETALGLPQNDREELAVRLMITLNDDDPLSPEWQAEIERRIAAADRGEVNFLSHEEVWARIDAKYGKLTG